MCFDRSLILAQGPPQYSNKKSAQRVRAEHFGIQLIPTVAPRAAPSNLGRECDSESYSENAPEFRELL